jgi:two-component system CheB/CheR fusion protein
MTPRHGALERIAGVLRARTGHDFSQYRQPTLLRTVDRRMAFHHFSSPESYLKFVQENPQEQELLYGEFLVGVTSFFRDAPAWEALRVKVLPALLARHAGGLRAWVPGCSTGEEAYSLAMVFKEAQDEARPPTGSTLQIFATDLNPAAVARASEGRYPPSLAADVSAQRLARFFVRGLDGSYRVGEEIREMVILAPQDVIRDPPFTRLDLVLCRNLLVYLQPELQRRLLPLFHLALNPGGVLFLGASESIAGQEALFAPIDAGLRIFRRQGPAGRVGPDAPPSAYAPPHPVATLGERDVRAMPNLAALAEQLILRQFGPPAVLIDPHGDVVYSGGPTGNYLEPTAGRANWNIFDKVREGLRHRLTLAVQGAARCQWPVTVTGLRLLGQGAHRRVDFTVRPVEGPGPLQGLLLVVFSESATPPVAAGPVAPSR